MGISNDRLAGNENNRRPNDLNRAGGVSNVVPERRLNKKRYKMLKKRESGEQIKKKKKQKGVLFNQVMYYERNI